MVEGSDKGFGGRSPLMDLDGAVPTLTDDVDFGDRGGIARGYLASEPDVVRFASWYGDDLRLRETGTVPSVSLISPSSRICPSSTSVSEEEGIAE
jgi:hypothetical protein